MLLLLYVELYDTLQSVETGSLCSHFDKCLLYTRAIGVRSKHVLRKST